MTGTRVLTLIDSLGVTGGGERIAMELTKALDPDRFQRALCVSRWDPAVAQTEAGAAAVAGLEQAGVELLPLERGSRADLRPWSRLRGLLRERRVDVLHAHKFGSNVWGAMVGRAARVPVVVAHEHSWSYEGRLGRRLADRQLIARLVDALIAVSREDLRRMIEIEGIPRDLLRLIPNGMPPVPRLGDGGDLRAELGLSGQPVIGSVGAIRPEKRFDLLVEAAGALHLHFPDLQLVVAGEGDPAPLQARAAELGIGEAVHFLGARSDVGAVLGAFDVGVNCSEREGASLSVMEYMDAGLAVVATRVGGTPDLIEDGVSGVLVEPDNPAALADGISQMLENRGVAELMGSRARQRRHEEFSFETMARRVEALYEELLSEKGRAPA